MIYEKTNTNFDKLIGKVVTDIYVDQNYLVIKTKNDKVVMAVEGDCCSHSYWVDIIGVKNLIGKKVLHITDELNGYEFDDKRGTQECNSIYNYCLVTKKGNCNFIFVNSSNGYYGGYIINMDDIYNNILNGLTRITEDWKL